VSVPSSELGPPLTRERVCLPRNLKGEGQHPLAGEGVGGPSSDDWKESLALWIFCEPGIRNNKKDTQIGTDNL
jgi:hypothetical protein